MKTNMCILCSTLAICTISISCQQSELERFDEMRAKELNRLREQLKNQPGSHDADEAYVKLFMMETDDLRSKLIKELEMKKK